MIARTLSPLLEGVVDPSDTSNVRKKKGFHTGNDHEIRLYNENEPKANLARRNLYWFDQIHQA